MLKHFRLKNPYCFSSNSRLFSNNILISIIVLDTSPENSHLLQPCTPLADPDRQFGMRGMCTKSYIFFPTGFVRTRARAWLSRDLARRDILFIVSLGVGCARRSFFFVYSLLVWRFKMSTCLGAGECLGVWKNVFSQISKRGLHTHIHTYRLTPKHNATRHPSIQPVGLTRSYCFAFSGSVLLVSANGRRRPIWHPHGARDIPASYSVVAFEGRVGRRWKIT